MKLLHLTDTHFVPRGKELYGKDPAVALRAAVTDICANHTDAEHMVITGDLTHWGEAEAFEYLAEVLAPIPVPKTLLIGNHDDRDVFQRFFPDQTIDENGFVQSVKDVSAGRFIFLDTMLEGTHAGHYCQTRLAWLEHVLREAEGGVFLFMHHPPFALGLDAIDKISLQQRAEFADVVRPYNARIRHLFFGHVHRPVAGSWLGIPISSVRAFNHQVWFTMNGGPLPGSHEPPGYSVILIEDDQVIVHFHDFMDDSPKFPMSDSPWNDWSRKNKHP